MGEFSQHLHLIGFYNVLNLQTRALSWFVYLAIRCFNLPCRLGRLGRQLATVALEYEATGANTAIELSGR